MDDPVATPLPQRWATRAISSVLSSLSDEPLTATSWGESDESIDDELSDTPLAASSLDADEAAPALAATSEAARARMSAEAARDVASRLELAFSATPNSNSSVSSLEPQRRILLLEPFRRVTFAEADDSADWRPTRLGRHVALHYSPEPPGQNALPLGFPFSPQTPLLPGGSPSLPDLRGLVDGTAVSPLYDEWDTTRADRLSDAHIYRLRLVRAFVEFVSNAALQGEENKQLLQPALAHWIQQSYSLAWEMWSGRSSELAQLRKATSMIVNSRILPGWCKWLEIATQRGHKLGLAHSAAGRLKSRQLSGCWNQWVWHALSWGEEVDVMRRALGFVMKSKFYAWLDFAADSREWLESSAIGKAVHVLRSNQLAAGWRAWAQEVAHQSVQFLRLMEAGLHLFNRAILPSWKAWASFLSVRQQQLHAARQSLAFMLHRQMAAGWRCWLQSTREATAKWRGASVLIREQASALRTWYEMAVAQSAVLMALQRGVARWSHGGMAAGLAAWQQACAERAELHRRASHMRSPKFRLFRSWRSAATASAATMSKLRRSTAGTFHRRTKLAWNAWIAFTKGRLADFERLIRSAGRMRNGKLVGGWHVWSAYAVTRGEALRRLRAGTARLLQRGLSMAFDALLMAAERDAGCRGIMRRIANQDLARVLCAWVEMAEASAIGMHTKRRAAASWLHRGLSDAMGQWWLLSMARQTRLVQMRRGIACVANRRLLDGWRPWVRHTHQTARWRVWVRRLSNSALASALSLWQMHAAEGERSMLLLRSSAGVLLSRQLTGAFHAWCISAGESQGALEKLHRAGAKLFHRHVSLAWEAWATHAEERAAERQRVRRAIASLVDRGWALAWRRWASLARQRSRTFDAVRRVVLNLVHQRLSMAWHAWHGFAAAALGKKCKRRRVFVRFVHLELAAGWRCWLQSTREATAKWRGASVLIREQASALRTWYEMAVAQSAVLMALQRGVARWSHGGMAAGLAAWQQACAERAELHRRASHMRSPKFRLFRSWRSAATASAATMSKLRRSTAGTFHRRTKLAWNAWIAFTKGRLADFERLIRSAGRMRNGKLVGGWHVWSAYAVTRGEALRRLRAGTARLLQRGLSMAFDALLMAAERDAGCRGIMRRIANQDLARVLCAWVEMAEASAIGMHTKRRAAASWLHRGLSDAMGQWWLLSMARQTRLVQMRRGIACVANRRLLDGWRPWVRHTHQTARWRVWVRRLSNSALASALSLWQMHAAEGERSMLLLRSSAGVLLSRQLTGAFHAWCISAGESQGALEKLHRAGAKLFHRHVSLAWEAWATHAEERAAERQRVRRAIASLVDRGWALAWRRWALAAMTSRRSMYRARYFFANLQQTGLRRLYLVWRAAAFNRRQLLATVNRFVPEHMRQKVEALRAWTFRCEKWLEAEQQLVIGRSLFFQSTRKALEKWSAEAVSRHLAARLQATGATIKLGRAKRCLNTWVAGCQARSNRRQRMASCMFRLKSARAKGALMQWLAMIAVGQGQRDLLRFGMSVWSSSHLSVAFAAWAAEWTEGLLSFERGLVIWEHSSLAKAWRMWTIMVQRAANIFRLGVLGATRTTSMECRAALALWAALTQARLREWSRFARSDGLARLNRELVEQRLLRRLVQVWASLASQTSLACARRILAKRWKGNSTSQLDDELSTPRGDILGELSPSDRARWPRAWLDNFGWSLTWRNVPGWLDSLGLPVKMPHGQAVGQAGMLKVLGHGKVYTHIIDLASAQTFTAYSSENKADWRQNLVNFFSTELAEQRLSNGKELCTHVRRGKAADHLVVLTALRVLIEMNEPGKWAQFLASKRRSTVGVPEARVPRFTPRDPLDDHSEETANTVSKYVCLGCPTPRILGQKVKCGKCAMLATISTDEYLAMFSLNQQCLFERNH